MPTLLPIPVVGALLDGQNFCCSPSPLPSLSSGSVLVVGNEGRGLTPQVRECVTHPVTIPNLGGTAESLNAAVACAILMAQMLQKP